MLTASAMDILAETIDEDRSDTENGGAGRVVEKQDVFQVASADEAGRVEEAAKEEKDEDAPMLTFFLHLCGDQ